MNSVRTDAIIKVKEEIFIKEYNILYPEILIQLYDYQIQNIYAQIEDYLEVNKASEIYHFEMCPECGFPHPNLRKMKEQILVNSYYNANTVENALL